MYKGDGLYWGPGVAEEPQCFDQQRCYMSGVSSGGGMEHCSMKVNFRMLVIQPVPPCTTEITRTRNRHYEIYDWWTTQISV
jgi:hypothetical protein